MVPRSFLKNNLSSRAALPSHPFCAASDLRPELCGWLVPCCTICTSAPANGRESKGLQTIVSRLCSLIAPLWQRLLLGQSAMCREDCADSEAKLQKLLENLWRDLVTWQCLWIVTCHKNYSAVEHDRPVSQNLSSLSAAERTKDGRRKGRKGGVERT